MVSKRKVQKIFLSAKSIYLVETRYFFSIEFLSFSNLDIVSSTADELSGASPIEAAQFGHEKCEPAKSCAKSKDIAVLHSGHGIEVVVSFIFVA